MHGKPYGLSRTRLPISAIPSFVSKKKQDTKEKIKEKETKEKEKDKEPNEQNQTRNAIGCNHPAVFFSLFCIFFDTFVGIFPSRGKINELHQTKKQHMRIR